MLINSLLSHVNDARWDEFVYEIEQLNVRKAVIVRQICTHVYLQTERCPQRLMSSHVTDDLTSCILDFQANMIRVTYRKKTTLVEPRAEPAHDSLLQYIWDSSKLREEVDPDGQVVKWKKLGFGSENIIEEFQEVGLLGLDCLFNFVQSDAEFFSKVLHIGLLECVCSYQTPGRSRATKPT